MKLSGRSPAGSRNTTSSDTPGRQGRENDEEKQSHLPLKEKKEPSPAPPAASNDPHPAVSPPLASSTPAKTGGKVRVGDEGGREGGREAVLLVTSSNSAGESSTRGAGQVHQEAGTAAAEDEGSL